MYGSWGFRPYVSVAERRRKAEKAVSKLAKKGQKITPIQISGRTIASTFWGKGWCDHLESFSDYENRLPRGRTYVRNGSVVHLEIGDGKIEALVQGSSLYKIKVDIKAVDKKKWNAIVESCSGQIDSVVELLQGELSSGVMKTISDRKDGLFPQPKEIALNCSCPDWAVMCKHVAAVLYGVGARLDNEPELLFKLRCCNHLDLITQASMKTPAKHIGKALHIEGENLSDLFGIDVDSAPAEGKIARSTVGKKKPSKKKTGKKKAKAAKRESSVQRGKRK
jgi:uncharacterized Zn finger protein